MGIWAQGWASFGLALYSVLGEEMISRNDRQACLYLEERNNELKEPSSLRLVLLALQKRAEYFLTPYGLTAISCMMVTARPLPLHSLHRDRLHSSDRISAVG